MTNTETEAKTKACCKGSSHQTRNNGPCIASECMAWRWSWALTPSGAKTDIKSTTDGYCGLAGAP